MVAERDAVADAATFDLASHSVTELLVAHGRVGEELCDRGKRRIRTEVGRKIERLLNRGGQLRADSHRSRRRAEAEAFQADAWPAETRKTFLAYPVVTLTY